MSSFVKQNPPRESGNNATPFAERQKGTARPARSGTPENRHDALSSYPTGRNSMAATNLRIMDRRILISLGGTAVIARLTAQSEAPMIVIRKGNHAQPYQELLPKRLPTIELHHGEAIWVLTELGFRGPAAKSTFHEYIKSLRKLGTPFKRGEIGFSRRGLANYSYCHLMELALALTLRVYNVVPDSVLVEIIRHRATLYRCYRRAYVHRCTGIGAPVDIEVPGETPIKLRGTFLELQMKFSGGRLARFGPPKLLSPVGALNIFRQRDIAARAFLPINLSALAELVVGAALQAPLIRRGRPSP